MLQGNLETLVSACAGGSSDRKIACETLADDHKTDPPERHPDSPPESFWLSRDEETEWFNRNAVYERKESTKGNSNSTNLNPNFNSYSNSQRFSSNLKSKTSMIGLPKPQKPSFVDAKNLRNHKPSNIRLFPKRTASVGKSSVEPSSPKVSCIGRVRSKRDRNRKLSSAENETVTVKEKPVRTGKKHSFFESFRAIFRSGRRNKPDHRTDYPAFDSSVTNTNSVSNSKARNSTGSVNDVSFVESVSRNSVSESEPAGLGGMMRFTSGRRSESWGVDESEIHVSR
ncbi:uncharacterized protein [Cicer arietinum]|uniref:Uncharacterized protein LOC101512495 n=1 Tax=Cicer arietinum TaxID=3827 RepID=A0A1S2XT93_CICAR|nr:uncharacterized protein LOC101512495 [Cicer arietinum]